MKLYHGTNATSAYSIFNGGIDLSKSMLYLDFGQGFYTTDDKDKAIKRARKKTAQYNKRRNASEKPCLVEITIDEIHIPELNVKCFDTADEEWCEFVTNNRFSEEFLNEKGITNHNRDNRYDIVCGEIADGKIAKIVSDIKAGKYDILEADHSKYYTDSGKSYGFQISFHTEKALKYIRNIEYSILDDENPSIKKKKKR